MTHRDTDLKFTCENGVALINLAFMLEYVLATFYCEGGINEMNVHNFTDFKIFTKTISCVER